MGRVRETLHDALRQTDAVLLALCVASTLYGMVLIASATSFRGTLKYVAVQGLGLLIGLVLYFFLSSIDVFELAKQWKWLLGFNVGFLLLLLTDARLSCFRLAGKKFDELVLVFLYAVAVIIHPIVEMCSIVVDDACDHRHLGVEFRRHGHGV